MKFVFIAEQKAFYAIAILCDVLGVSGLRARVFPKAKSVACWP